ncbi:MAG: hypothetical protein Q9187_005520 [Circinaria calcarea]
MSSSRSHSKDAKASYGRGGAGNIKPTTRHSPPPDLVTPTIKSERYTTGRGGQGNMAKNDPYNPQLARESQDVGPAPRRLSMGDTHVGRGGVANITRYTIEEVEKARAENARLEKEMREAGKLGDGNEKIGMADKGKAMLLGKRE